MKVFAVTLLSLLALSQARVNYKLQCTREEVGIRWPSYYSNSEYFVCQSVFGTQLTVHCPPGEVFTFVLQQCTVPALYVPPPQVEALPTSAQITTHTIDDSPPLIGQAAHEPHQPHMEHAQPMDPTPPTPPTEPPTPPTVVVDPPSPGKKPAPMPLKPSSPKKPSVPAPAKATAKKPAAPSPAKAAKKPAPPSKVQKPLA